MEVKNFKKKVFCIKIVSIDKENILFKIILKNLHALVIYWGTDAKVLVNIFVRIGKLKPIILQIYKKCL